MRMASYPYILSQLDLEAEAKAEATKAEPKNIRTSQSSVEPKLQNG